MTPSGGHAYVMPSDQLFGLMAPNFSKFETLVITQFTQLVNAKDQEVKMLLEEKIWLKSPGLFHAQLLGQPEGLCMMADNITPGSLTSDMAFRQLLMTNSAETITSILSEMGINLGSVAFTRLDGIVAYRVGDVGPEAPRLLIEKERFLPLLLSYRLLGDSGHKMITVRFDDYRQLDAGWYPYEIIYSTGEESIERYYIFDLQVNVPIQSSLLDGRREGIHSVQGLGTAHAIPEEAPPK